MPSVKTNGTPNGTKPEAEGEAATLQTPLADTPLTIASHELTTAVDEMIKQLKSKFDGMSGDMLAKMDDMSQRLDQLETQMRNADASSDAGTAASRGSRAS